MMTGVDKWRKRKEYGDKDVKWEDIKLQKK